MVKKKRSVLQAITAVFAVCFMCIAFASIAFAASSSYGFTMTERFVSGADNGQYHSLRAGNRVHIHGTQYSSQIDGQATPTMNPVYYDLYRERFGPDVKLGEVYGGRASTVDGYFDAADVTSSDYYITAYKAEVDHWKVVGSGTVTN